MLADSLWTNMFEFGISPVEKIFRPVLIYLFLIVGLRLAGKRELAQLNTFDLIVLLTLSNTVQNAIIGNDNSVSGGLLGATTLLVVNSLVVRFVSRHPVVEKLIQGDATVLIENGKVLPDRLQEEGLTLPELVMAAHKQGFGSLAELDRAVLEPGGFISFTGLKPVPEVARHGELLERLQQIQAELAELRAERKLTEKTSSSAD